MNSKFQTRRRFLGMTNESFGGHGFFCTTWCKTQRSRVVVIQQSYPSFTVGVIAHLIDGDLSDSFSVKCDCAIGIHETNLKRNLIHHICIRTTLSMIPFIGDIAFWECNIYRKGSISMDRHGHSCRTAPCSKTSLLLDKWAILRHGMILDTHDPTACSNSTKHVTLRCTRFCAHVNTISCWNRVPTMLLRMLHAVTLTFSECAKGCIQSCLGATRHYKIQWFSSCMGTNSIDIPFQLVYWQTCHGKNKNTSLHAALPNILEWHLGIQSLEHHECCARYAVFRWQESFFSNGDCDVRLLPAWRLEIWLVSMHNNSSDHVNFTMHGDHVVGWPVSVGLPPVACVPKGAVYTCI